MLVFSKNKIVWFQKKRRNENSAFQVLKRILKRKRSLSDSVLVKDVGINCIAFTNSRKVYKYQISGMAHNKEVFVRRKCQFRKEKQERHA